MWKSLFDFQGLWERWETVVSFSELSISRHFHGLLHAGLCRQSFWRTVEVYLVRRERIQAGVWTGGVEEIDVAADLCSGLLDRLVGVQIDMLILDRLPEPLDENIVAPASFAIHADGDACLLEPPGEGFTGELTALIRVEDLGLAVLGQGFFQRCQTEGCVHRDRQRPSQNATAEPVDHRGQIDEATRHGDVADVHCPGLIRTRDGQITQQVGVNPVSWRGFGRVGLAIDGLDAHPPHQRFDMSATHFQPLLTPQIGFRDRTRLVVHTAAADLKNLRLPADRQPMFGIDHRFALSNPAFVSAFSKKSFSSVNSPILACSTVTSTLEAAGSSLASPKTPAAPS